MTWRKVGLGRMALRSVCVAGAVLLLGGAAPRTPFITGQPQLAVGEYLVAIGGCNDCHTASWNQAPGQVPTAQRLTGNPVGWRGPWGTSYAINLRLFVARLTPEAWVNYIEAMQPRPPMPWYNLRVMSEPDLRAMYAYIRSLGPAGEPTPEPVPPGQPPQTPYIDAVPRAPG